METTCMARWLWEPSPRALAPAEASSQPASTQAARPICTPPRTRVPRSSKNELSIRMARSPTVSTSKVNSLVRVDSRSAMSSSSVTRRPSRLPRLFKSRPSSAAEPSKSWWVRSRSIVRWSIAMWHNSCTSLKTVRMCTFCSKFATIKV